MKKYTILLLIIFLTKILTATEYNWSSWKGPNHNGISDETKFNPQALNSDLKINWKKNIGAGYSNVAIYNNYLITLGFDKKNKKNILFALNVNSGKQIWTFAYKASKGRYEGPKSTPVISDNKIYHLGQDGDLYCHDLKTGKVIWHTNIVKKYSAENLHWYFSSSVLIYNDMAIISACKSGMAFNKNDGSLVWKSAAGQGNYATPVKFSYNGNDLLGIYGKDHFYAVMPETGKISWSYPWETKYNIIASDPAFYDNKVLISTGYGVGSTVIDYSEGKPKQLWQHDDLCTHFSTSVIIDGFIYGIDGNAGQGYLKCVELNTGKIQWSQKNGFGSVIAANNHLIMINEKGSIFIIKVNKNKYEEVSKKERIIKKLCWTAPVLCRGNVYIRNNLGDLISINIK